MTLGERQIQLPSGSYVVIEAEADPRARFERERVALRIAEVASLITLRHPHLLDEKIFEGVINVPGRFLAWSEGPVRLTAAPAVDPSDVISGFRNSIAAVRELDTETQYRFQLASRWFRRGHEATNEVDRFLFWWTVLEVYPREKGANIIRDINTVLGNHVFPRVARHELEKNLRIGRMYSERKRIVHEGRSFVDVDDNDFRASLERLGLIAGTLLRLLCGIPPGDDLQEFM